MERLLIDDIFKEVLLDNFPHHISENELSALDYLAVSDNIIFEVFEPNVKLLPEMEEAFAKVKKDFMNKKYLRNLFNVLNKFYHGKLVELKIFPVDFLNAYIFTDYSSTFFSKRLFKKPELEDIKGIYVGIGADLIKLLTPRECVAVVLHETGHVLQHTVRVSFWMLGLCKWVFRLIHNRISMAIFGILARLFGKIMIPIMFSIYIFGRTLYFTQHLQEYDADKFCVKYGYGEDMISVVNKFTPLKIKKGKDDLYVTKMKRYLKALLQLLFTRDPTHPISEQRVCRLVTEMNKLYNNQYKIKSKEVKEILRHIEC